MYINIRKIALSLFVTLSAMMFVSCNDEQEITFAKSLAETILRSPNVLSEIRPLLKSLIDLIS